MQNTHARQTIQVAKEVIRKHIASLKDFIESSENPDEVVLFAAIQLVFIGTKEASDALMDLIEQRNDSYMRDAMISALIGCSPFRSNYRERIKQITEDQREIDGLYAEIAEGLVSLSKQPPLWQEVAEALETELADRRHGPELFRG